MKIVTLAVCYWEYLIESVLGPLLFLLYINDLPSKISSTISFYADDVILYREINSEEDMIFQTDLSIIASWAQDWLMSLNLSKCEHLAVTNKQNPIKSFYKLNDQILCQVSVKSKIFGSYHQPNLILARSHH